MEEAISEASLQRQETHPWLKWPRTSAAEKIELNNALALHQHKVVCPPRMMDWEVINSIGIAEELNNLLLTRSTTITGFNFDIPIWKRAFDVREDSYREWMLEFFCSLTVETYDWDDEVLTAKMVKFRLGGVKHEVTLPRFGVLTGLLTEEEESNEALQDYFLRCSWDSSTFKQDIHEVWNNLSGMRRHTSTSKAKSLRSPILRILHKLLCYSFFHRSTHADKVYEDDLWVLSNFNARDPHRYVNAVWALAEYMESNGAGKSPTSQMVCGHFVTRIARNLGLMTNANRRMCSPPIKWRYITKRDLEILEVLTPRGTHLRGYEEGPQEQPPPPPAPRGSMSDAVFQMAEQMGRMSTQVVDIGRDVREIHQSVNETNWNMRGFGNYVDYHVNRYQPSWEYSARQHYDAFHQESSSTNMWFPYAPPQMFPPYPQQQQEEEEREEEDD